MNVASVECRGSCLCLDCFMQVLDVVRFQGMDYRIKKREEIE